MVAITVILAAVIGAFVLEIGDQQETAPSTSFDSKQTTEYFSQNQGTQWKSSNNLTRVYISHAGGDTVSLSNIYASVQGNNSVWGVEENIKDNTASGATDPDWLVTDKAEAVPNLFLTYGTNEKVELQSGQTMTMIGYDGPNRDYWKDIENARTNPGGIRMTYKESPERPALTWKESSWKEHELTPLETGDKVRIVWKADSGGKTQTMFKYTVQ
jgi:hypothetical protein